MREIRAWDKRENKMIYLADAKNSKNLLAVGFHGLPIAVDQDSFRDGGVVGWNVDHYITLMEHTGLSDGNGRKIFEGDILGFGPHGNMSVCFECGAFKAIDNELRFYLGDYELSVLEVIGNIYENPDMLST